MPLDPQFAADAATILGHRYDLGADLWTTPDKRLIKGAPFSTLECVSYLAELGMGSGDPVISDAIELIFSASLPDGRFRVYPKSTPLTCHTTNAAWTLCWAGVSGDARMQATLNYLLESRWNDTGWRCNRSPFGKGPQCDYPNAHPTLLALDTLRLSGYANNDTRLDGAVRFLLDHWEVKRPIGPCRYGIGTLFMQPEYPFRSYNLFHWVYVLSFYNLARADARFREAYQALADKIIDGQVVVERVVPKLAKLSFCRKGEPSVLATKRWQEITANLAA